jgi:ubiquinone/menaquinone biosynthesis C-methylase UbiE
MENKSKEYFQKTAEVWDELRSGYFQATVRDSAIAKAYLRPEMTVADIGGGTGFISAGLAPQVTRVHIVDASQEMLTVARRNLKGFANIAYHLADGTTIPLESDSMDAVFANMFLHHCPDPFVAIQEMTRILKPGGRLIITDMDSHTHQWAREEMADVWLGFERNQMREWYRRAGLVNIFVDCTGQDCCATSGEINPESGQHEEAKVSIFIAVGSRHVSYKSTVESVYSLAATEGCGCGCSSDGTSGRLAPASADCCTSTNVEELGYEASDIQLVPLEAGEISLGCGNPLAFAGLKTGETVLDIGSGGGMDAFLSANKVGPQGKVIGVDMTPAMLERARTSAQKNGYHQVEFRQGEAHNLPVADASVDVVISNCVINLTEDKGKVFKEAYRVLKPGGRLEISDTVTSGSLPASLRANGREWAACVSGSLPAQEYLDLIAEAGFDHIRTVKSDSYQAGSTTEIYSMVVSAIKPKA